MARPLGDFEAKVVDLIASRVSRNEAREVRLIVRWLGDFLLARGKDLLTANNLDLQDFCEQRSTTRVDSSMVRLISSIKAVYRSVHDAQFRNDDPAVDLQRPRLPAVMSTYGVDEGILERLSSESTTGSDNGPQDKFVKLRLSAILRLAKEAGAFYPEIAALDLVDLQDLVLARGGGRERRARLSDEGHLELERYAQIRRSFITSPSIALFTMSQRPWKRLDGKSLSTIVRKAIHVAGISSADLTPGRIHRSVPGAIVGEGLGWDVGAASAAYSKIPTVQRAKSDLETMKRLIESFDRFHIPN